MSSSPPSSSCFFCKEREAEIFHHELENGKQNQSLKTNSFCKLLSFNAFCRPPGIKNKSNDWKSERLDYLYQHSLHQYSIVAFQELFGSFSSRRDTFLKNCQNTGFHYYTVSPRPSWKFLIDGGLAIISKYPIVDCRWRAFAPGIHSDRLAEKGVLYAKIELSRDQNLYLHVFNAHTQSSYNDPEGSPSWKVRERQTTKMLDFVAECTKDDSYPFALLGDLNINARKEMPAQIHSREYLAFLNMISNLKTKRGEYDAPHAFIVKDVLFEFSKVGEHPITFGDSELKLDGAWNPLETVFTKPHDYNSFQSLDFIFWGTRPEQTSHSNVIQKTDEETFNLQAVNAEVAKMLVPESVKVSENLQFTQLSDHYGAEMTIGVAK